MGKSKILNSWLIGIKFGNNGFKKMCEPVARCSFEISKSDIKFSHILISQLEQIVIPTILS